MRRRRSRKRRRRRCLRKDGVLFDQLRDYQLLKKGSAP
jgi:hypothetical protein